MNSPLAGNIVRVDVAVGDRVDEEHVVIILEAMKMETEVRATKSGVIVSVAVKSGDAVAVGDPLLTIG